jgi:hypothetical protein
LIENKTIFRNFGAGCSLSYKYQSMYHVNYVITKFGDHILYINYLIIKITGDPKLTTKEISTDKNDRGIVIIKKSIRS